MNEVKPMAEPRVSIILTTRNSAGTISECLVSLLDQSERAWQCIIVDRGSTDESLQVARSIVSSDARFTFIDAPAATLGAARNRAMADCRGTYVLFLDAQDWLALDALKLLFCTAIPTGAACGCFERRGTFGESLGGPERIGHSTIGLAELHEQRLFPVHAQLIRADLLGSQRFSETLTGAEDQDLWLRLAEHGIRWTVVDEPVAYVRLRPVASVIETKSLIAEHVRTFQQSYARSGSGPSKPGTVREYSLAYATMALSVDPASDAAQLAQVLLNSPGSLDRMISSQTSDTDRATERPILRYAGIKWDALPAPLAISPARWWQRCGFLGRAPRAIDDHTRMGLAGIIGSPDRAPSMMVDRAEPGRPIVMLGMGKNARRIAAELAGRGMPIVGCDDQLTSLPAWAIEDRCDVQLLPCESAYDPASQYFMTVLADEEYLRRLPRGLTIIRWADVLDEIKQQKDCWLASWDAA